MREDSAKTYHGILLLLGFCRVLPQKFVPKQSYLDLRKLCLQKAQMTPLPTFGALKRARETRCLHLLPEIVTGKELQSVPEGL